MQPDLPRRHFTVDEVLRMVETGVLQEDEHVELLWGELVEVSPQGPLHSVLIRRLTRQFLQAYDTRFGVDAQLPLSVGAGSLPEPDFAVFRIPAGEDPTAHPRGADALLVVEVSVTSQRLDRLKAGLYAAGGVPVYWLLDVEARQLHVFREPDGERYTAESVLQEADLVDLPGLDLRWRVDALLA
ncbi:MAG: Uma2 family endonuclease [Alphaproteobacteria bacterium]|nr:Uma2 family endonuclease [Alphaproteobacteria bacterium]